MSRALAIGGLVLASGAAMALSAGRTTRDGLVGALRTAPVAVATGSEGTRIVMPRQILMATGVLSAVTVFFLVGGIPGLLAAVTGAAVTPRLLRARRRARASEQLEGQLAGAVSGIAAGLRAGLSLSQALRFAAGETGSPLADELREVTVREDLGLPLERSLLQWEAASPSDDVHLVGNVMRLRIGSGLPSVLDQVARALRQRQSAKREVRSLTAQARLSGTILGLLPVGFFLFLSLASKRDMTAALETPAGVGAIAGGLVLEAGAYFWIRRLIRVQT